MGMEKALEQLKQIHEGNLAGGGEKHVQRQHDRGKLTGRERMDLLFDPGTFRELGSVVNTTGRRIDGRESQAPCDGAVIGTGKVNGRRVAAYASDFTVLGGSIGVQHGLKFIKLIEMAAKWGVPMVWLLDSSGGRLGYKDVPQGGIDWWFLNESRYSGVIPQINSLMGPCIAGQAYCPTLCDFLLMTRGTAHLWLGGPRMTQAATSEKIGDEVGGADYHMEYSGTCDLAGDTDPDTILLTRELLSYLPQNFRETAPLKPTKDPIDRPLGDLYELVPDDCEKTYDVRRVVSMLVDDGDFLEIKPTYAPQLFTGFARMGGQSVGIAASNPAFPGSAFAINACDKYYRFLQALDSFNIPLISLVDTPPVLPGEDQEARGLLRHMGKIIDLYATSTVPKISLVLRQSFADAGGLVLGGVKGLGADLCYAWPGSRFSVEASDLDFSKIYGRGLESGAKEYRQRSRKIVDVFEAARSWTAQAVDEVIYPENTRQVLVEALELTKNKKETLWKRKKIHNTAPC